MPLPEPGETRIDDPPPSARSATRRAVTWADANGDATTDPDRVAWAEVVYYDDDYNIVESIRGFPDPDGDE